MSETAASLPASYAHWQKRLAHEFFSGHRGQPVVMFVDRNELDILADSGEDGPTALASAVRTLVDITRGVSMFARVKSAEQDWIRGKRIEPPPTLPVLAISVFAASEMRNDATASSNNYYVRLADALLPEGTEPDLERLRYALRERQAFLDVVAMWRHLGAWLDQHDGAYGVSTIPEVPGPLTRISFPLSQTLLRRSDRASLTRFFDRMRLTKAGVPSPDALLRLLKLWTSRRPEGFSNRFLQALNDPSVQTVLKPLIHDLATNWDGKIVTAGGLRRLDIRLVIDIDRAGTWWVIPLVSDAPTDTLTGTYNGKTFTATIIPDRHTSVYREEGLPPVTSQALIDGLSARGHSCVAEFRPSDLMVFIDSADAGGWMSVDAVQAYEEHVFAVRLPLADDVEAALELAADRGWRRLPDNFANQILSGYAIYYGITFSDKERLNDSSDLEIWRVAGNIELGTTVRPRLVNGLPLFRNLVRGTYLASGEPDLELPIGAEKRWVPVVLDGSPPHKFLASIFPIPFSVILRGELGVHTIEADGETLAFEVIDGGGSDWVPPGVGSIGWNDGFLSQCTDWAVCGSLTPTDCTLPTVLIRRGAQQNWIIDSSGHLTAFEEPLPPTFIPGASFAYFEVGRDRGAWVLQRRIKGWYVTSLGSAEPNFGKLSTSEQQVWVQAAEQVRSGDPMWRLFVAAWERTSG